MLRRGASFPAELSALALRVEDRIDALFRSEIARWADVDPALADPLAALRDLVLAGGKRLRPAFCAAAFVGAGGDLDDPVLVDAGGALELLHTFALVHDDVMDGSTTRRGLSAVHTRFEAAHDAEELGGERRRFGEGIAILVGDFAVVYADVLLRRTPAATLELWDELRLELCVGQSLDLVGAARRSTDRDFADRIARYKSAKYTVERPLHLGAALHGDLVRLQAPLSAIGIPLGTAFQLRDDILGVFGDAELIGKPVGDDLREGKPTLLVALAADRADDEGRRALARIGNPDLDDVEVKQLQELLVSTEALRSVEHRIDDLVAEAAAAIDAAPLGADARALLGDLASYVAWRDH